LLHSVREREKCVRKAQRSSMRADSKMEREGRTHRDQFKNAPVTKRRRETECGTRESSCHELASHGEDY